MESGVYFSLSVVPQLPEHSVKLFLKTSEFGLSKYPNQVWKVYYSDLDINVCPIPVKTLLGRYTVIDFSTIILLYS
jgi:hypothetical protein